ncbi:uncharacterized protein LOC142236940 [Haematobia irritans]|uniref:uncharacterized protein LOC142236940 n=1 Tax=Haematobia irritans TaxID=7368 RepID=UPI003F4FAA94
MENTKEDYASKLASTWEEEFRALSPKQRMYASRIISETLYLGQLSHLNENSYRSVEIALTQNASTSHKRPRWDNIKTLTDIEFEEEYLSGSSMDFNPSTSRKHKSKTNIPIASSSERISINVESESDSSEEGWTGERSAGYKATQKLQTKNHTSRKYSMREEK